MKRKYYLGFNARNVESFVGPYTAIAHAGGAVDIVFASDASPTLGSHGNHFAAVMGPFRTKRAAILTSETRPNPHIQTVADAERIAARLTSAHQSV